MPSKTRVTGRRWALRIGVAAVLGGLLGAGGGVYAVNRLDPAWGTRGDTARAKPAASAATKPSGAWPDPVGAPAGIPAADRALGEAPLTTVEVPSLVDLEEGSARAAIIDMGLQVGNVEFRASTRPAGIVLATTPAAGTLVAVQTPITLILSDGRGASPDSTTADDHRPDPLRIP